MTTLTRLAVPASRRAPRPSLLALLAVGALGGCDQVKELDGASGGEVPAVVQRAFDQTCAVSGCHAGSSPAAGLSLEAASSGGIIGGSSSQRPELPLVAIGDTAGSYLALKMITDDSGRTGDQMPIGGAFSPADQENVVLILGWIAGAPLDMLEAEAARPGASPALEAWLASDAAAAGDTDGRD